jgi:hypothetical protein
MFSCLYARLAVTFLILRLIQHTGKKSAGCELSLEPLGKRSFQIRPASLRGLKAGDAIRSRRTNRRPTLELRRQPPTQAAADEAAARQAFVRRDEDILAVSENPAIAFRGPALRIFY